MKIKSVSAKAILDSKKEKTIQIFIKTNVGNFKASSPSGKSKGKHEIKPYKKNIAGDIGTLKKLSEYFNQETIESFEDLRRIEDIITGHIGANSAVALEYAILKALAKEQKKQIWQIINPNAKKFPRLVGNCIGGGKHILVSKKPDFQEFLLIPEAKTIKEAFETNKKIKYKVEQDLRETDKEFKSKENSENAWISSLNEKELLEILKEYNTPLGLDVAGSSFYKRGKYYYENPVLKRDVDEQLAYLENLIKNFNIFYIEDAFNEEDFDSFAKLLKKFPNKLIVGDDLIVTNHKRLKKAIEKKAINAVIVKPNQCGSLLEVARVVELAKKDKIKIVFAHRSGETDEPTLADLAFGFQADLFKCGIDGKVREAKLKRLVEIEKGL